MSPWKSVLRSEAVPVFLGRHGVLLAVLDGVETGDLTEVTILYLAMRAFAGTEPGLPPLERVRGPGPGDYPLDDGAPRAVAHIPPGTRAVLAPNNRPQLVWLPDPGNRDTARPVPAGDLQGAIGPDVRLREMRIEITREPVTCHPWACGPASIDCSQMPYRKVMIP